MAARKRSLNVIANVFNAPFVRREAHVIRVEMNDHLRLAVAVAG